MHAKYNFLFGELELKSYSKYHWFEWQISTSLCLEAVMPAVRVRPSFLNILPTYHPLSDPFDYKWHIWDRADNDNNTSRIEWGIEYRCQHQISCCLSFPISTKPWTKPYSGLRASPGGTLKAGDTLHYWFEFQDGCHPSTIWHRRWYSPSMG